ncbi:DUF3786 domain-containing protein [Candidatus Magnetominusculus xianensis]|uniref:DUF3786 domain-containing protein n=1 Tax=Candidatus Magnetominusculus xianensis TaxID=1748249 RepID=A0ABR5SF47_9BACT|nr:DUF3786 domain-containing protein [Candidatus Magnetominusculus xianensis]KWT85395.1 hypothetical protein ASN18_1751 [Candidatus Magnetominusculus xianensis]MBF0405127.1 DUF3786 domain-containing protein [Nitrospirota bacterium]
MAGGEDKGWEQLSGHDPDDVCKRGLVSFDRVTNSYIIKSFNWNFNFYAKDRTITCDRPEGDALLNRLGDFYRLSSLWYLNAAKDIALTGQLAMPQNLTGGELFFRGSHVLPLARLAAKYESNKEGFLSSGIDILGGSAAAYGDAAVVLYPYPKIPVTLILWLTDDEFPARAECLLDTSCEFHLPIDIIWMTAMMCILLM